MNRVLAGFVLISAVGIAVSGLTLEHDLYEAARQREETELKNLSLLFIKHAEDTIDITDTTLVHLRHLFEVDRSKSHALELIKHMRSDAETAPRLVEVSILAADGTRQLGNDPRLTGADDAWTYPLFQDHRRSGDRSLRIGSLEAPAGSADWSLPLSRRMDDDDGNFDGVIVAYINAAYFHDFYRDIAANQKLSINLFNRTGEIVSRYPVIQRALGTIQHLPRAIEAAMATRPSFVFQYPSPVDGDPRTGALHRSQKYPLSAMTSESDHDIAEIWRAKAIYRTGFRIIVSVLFAVLGFAILWQFRRRQLISDELLLRQAEFRILAEGSGDAVLRTRLDGTIDYASPISAMVIGSSAADLKGTRLVALAHPDDIAQLEQTLLAVGASGEGRVSFSLANQGASPRRVTATLRLAGADHQGAVVVVVRDDTQQYLAEQELASLASTDPLTGLANRRTFTDELDREWKRAAREQHPISLLFIDADRFKSFNDLYGHLEGDHCLTAVADILSQTTKRAADRAARYGGEEFVLLLPNTDLLGARRIAEHVRAAIQARAIPHAGNGHFGIVTVSVGVSTERPQQNNARKPEILIAHADHALYDAKEAGRNSIRAFGDPIDASDVQWGPGPATP